MPPVRTTYIVHYLIITYLGEKVDKTKSSKSAKAKSELISSFNEIFAILSDLIEKQGSIICSSLEVAIELIDSFFDLSSYFKQSESTFE